MIIARYVLEIVSEASVVDASEAYDWDMREARVLADMPARLEEVEENLTDMLPDGFKAQIGGSDG